jgi:hypothetical protein
MDIWTSISTVFPILWKFFGWNNLSFRTLVICSHQFGISIFRQNFDGSVDWKWHQPVKTRWLFYILSYFMSFLRIKYCAGWLMDLFTYEPGLNLVNRISQPAQYFKKITDTLRNSWLKSTLKFMENPDFVFTYVTVPFNISALHFTSILWNITLACCKFKIRKWSMLFPHSSRFSVHAKFLPKVHHQTKKLTKIPHSFLQSISKSSDLHIFK